MPVDESKDQISLFDLTAPGSSSITPEEPPEKAPLRKVPKATTAKISGKKATPSKGDIPPTPPRVSSTRAARSVPGPVPEGDVRLTANIRQDLHLKLKIAAATRRTTIGELIEALVEQYL